MKKKKIYNIIIPIFIILFLTSMICIISKNLKNKKEDVEQIAATVLKVDESKVTIIDDNNNIYDFPVFGNDVKSGDALLIRYTGILDETKAKQSTEVISYKIINVEIDENGIPLSWKDNGIFSQYYVMAYNKLKELSLEEKIGQLLLVRYPDSNVLKVVDKYKPSGFVFFERDFSGKTKTEVVDMIDTLQDASKIPLLTAVDEEGGDVVRVSSNSKLATEKFKSPRELYLSGGMNAIKEDTITKSKLLKELELNLNLAPVVDVTTDTNAYMYHRTIGENTLITSEYAKTVIEASKNTDVSYTLKHFPGYGNNADTHYGTSTDTRTYDDILNDDIPPFEAGIKAGAEAVLVSHNNVTSIDPDNPASLSPEVHNLLRNNLKFTGVIITDDIAMGALDSINNTTIKAILAGNDLIITTDYETSFNEIKMAIEDNTIDESVIDHSVFRILAWKYYKNLMLRIK